MAKATTYLRIMRKRRKLSAKKLEEATGVSQKVIYELERGEKRANIQDVLTLAEYFGVSVSTLMAVRKDGDGQ